MIALDTNLLLYAFHPSVPEHQAASTALNMAQSDRRGWGWAAASMAEFWNLVTRGPIAPGLPRMATPGEAGAFLNVLLATGARIFEAQSGFGERLLEIATRTGIRGTKIFDLQIAVMARDGGATEIWTADQKFVELPGLKVVHPISTAGRS